MGGKSAPKPPDLSGLTNAELQISQQQLDLAKQQMGVSQSQFQQFMQYNQQQLEQSQNQYNQQMDIQKQALAQAADANAVSKQVADTQIQQMNQSMQYQQQDRDRYTNTILPLQDQYIQEAKDYSSPEKQAQAAAQALADNQTQLEAQRNNQMAQLAAMGVDPSQVMSSSLSSQLGVAGAAQGAMAANVARQQTIQTGYNMLGNAINMGNNLPMQAVQEGNSATNAGNSASGNMQSGVNAYSSASGIGATASGIRQNSLSLASQLTGSPMAWAQLGNQSYGGASNGIMNAGNLINQGYQNQLQGFQAQQNANSSMMSGIGTIASIAGMAMMAEGGSVDSAVSYDPSQFDGGAMGNASSPIDTSRLDAAIQSRLQASTDKSLASSATRGNIGYDLSLVGNGLSAMGNQSQQPIQYKNFLQPIMYRAEGGVMGLGGGASNNGLPTGRAMPTMASRDTIAARLSPGEYVIPADVVHQLGVSHFDKLIQKYHRPGA
jgi:hypothetical protein